MGERLSEAELIHLLQEKLPEELSEDEIQQLRERIASSPRIRDSLARQIALEQVLDESLGNVSFTLNDILERRTKNKRMPTVGSLWGWITAIGILVAIGYGATFLFELDETNRVSELGQASQLVQNSIPSDPPEEKSPPASSTSKTTNRRANGKNESVESKKSPVREKPTDKRANDKSQPKKDNVKPPPKQIAAQPAIPVNEKVAAAKKSEQRPEPEIVVLANEPAPWAGGLDAANPLRPIDEVWTAPISGSSGHDGQLPAKELRRWFETVPGVPHRIRTQQVGADVTASRFDGFAKLRAPWVENAVLRLSLYELNRLRIDFWCGEEGVVLEYFHAKSPHLWAAFAAERAGNQTRLNSTALLTTDSGRYQRSGGGTLELRYQEGKLVMSRGDLLLLALPMPAPPQEIYFDGSFRINDISMVRGEPLPIQPPAVAPSAIPVGDPALLDWFSELPEWAELRRSGDGSIELFSHGIRERPKSEEMPPMVWSATPLDRTGLYELIFRVNDPQPGTGLFVGDAEGSPTHCVAFFHEPRHGQVTFGYGWSRNGYLKASNVRVAAPHDPSAGPPVIVGEHQWIRMVFGFGVLKLYASGDGENWGRVSHQPIRNLSGRYATVGVFVSPGDDPRKITLDQLQVRELNGVTQLVSEDLRNRAPFFPRPDRLKFHDWHRRAIATKPDDVSHDEWLRVCALGLLQRSPSSDVAEQLLLGLLRNSLTMPFSVEERLLALEHAATLLDLWDAPKAAQFADLYWELGKQLRLEGEPHPYRRLISELLSSPIWTDARIQTLPETLIMYELWHAVMHDSWKSIHELCEVALFWNDTGDPAKNALFSNVRLRQYLSWAEFQARQHGGELTTPAPRIVGYVDEHPLSIELSKEVYNVMAEFQAALRGNDFGDACRIISDANRIGSVGLLPERQDHRHYVSFGEAIAMAMQDFPGLKTEMNRRFGESGMLRVRQAVADADYQVLTAATLQFYGTPASAEASRFLGDRELAAGRFSEAIGRYRFGLRNANDNQRDDLRARIRLAAAMLGANFGVPVTGEVELAQGVVQPAASFEALLNNLRKQHPNLLQGFGPTGDDESPSELIQPAVLSMQPRGKFEGEYGTKAGSSARPGSDWVSRQLATVADESTLYVSNRFQVCSYQSANGQLIWKASLGGDQGGAHDYRNIPATPLLLDDRLVARRITKNGSELTCLKKSNGEALWRTDKNVRVLSDAVSLLGKLMAFVGETTDQQMLRLELAEFDPVSGELITRHHVVDFKDEFSGRLPCRITAAEGNVYGVAAGAVFCCNSSGETEWVRQQPRFPVKNDASQEEQYYDPPFIADGFVYVSQPGVRGVECLEIDSGRLAWATAVPRFQRVLGLTDQLVVAQTAHQLEAIDRQNGAIIWRHPIKNRLDGHAIAGDHIVLATYLQTTSKTRTPSLTWLNVRNGGELARELLEEMTDADPYLGPLLVQSNRLWAFWGRGGKTGSREIVELTPTTGRVDDSSPRTLLADWIVSASEAFEAGLPRISNGWALATQGARGAFHDSKEGRTDVIEMQSQAGNGVHWTTELEPQAAAKLLLRVGHAKKSGWRLQVHVNGEKILSETIDDESAPQLWRDVRVDLAPYAGKRVWLSVLQQPLTRKGSSLAYWDRLQLEP